MIRQENLYTHFSNFADEQPKFTQDKKIKFIAIIIFISPNYMRYSNKMKAKLSNFIFSGIL